MTDSVATRVSKRNAASRARSPRLQEAALAGRGRFSTYPPQEKGIWNNQRPGFIDETWNYLWEEWGYTNELGGHMWRCSSCLKQIGRRRDFPDQDRKDDATIDHEVDWKKWINEKAAPSDDGNISAKSAKDAYNDLTNLVIMCRSCNSKKNGPRDVFD